MNENIDHLLSKYFDGTTSLREEELLRNYFRSSEIPEHLKTYQGMFGYFDQEKQALTDGTAPETSVPTHRKVRRLLWTMTAMAACIAITAGYFRWNAAQQECLCMEGSYAMIDGKCYTDKALIEYFMNQSRKVMGEELSSDPLSDQLQLLDFYGSTNPDNPHQ